MKTSIHVFRAAERMSQEELAIKINVSRQTIHAIERGKKTPSVELALKIALTFNTTVEKIFHLDNKNQL